MGADVALGGQFNVAGEASRDESLPELDFRSAAAKSARKCSPAAAASWASGKRLPGSEATTAPAPIRSSRHGRNSPLSQISPAGITANVVPRPAAARATAAALRRQAASTHGWWAAKAERRDGQRQNQAVTGGQGFERCRRREKPASPVGAGEVGVQAGRVNARGSSWER